jgi:hypothetical protein
LGKSWSALDWKMLVYFMAIWNRYYNEFWKLYGHLILFVFIWYIFPVFGIMYVRRKIWQPCWQPRMLEPKTGWPIFRRESMIQILLFLGSMLR